MKDLLEAKCQVVLGLMLLLQFDVSVHVHERAVVAAVLFVLG
jgi:hypothetical protein